MEQFLAQNWPILFIAGAWTITWEGLALWRSARSGDKKWFIALLVINTLGLLEIVYLYLVKKEK